MSNTLIKRAAAPVSETTSAGDGSPRQPHRALPAWEQKVRLLARFLAASLLPGLPFALVRHLLHQHSGIVNLDFFVLTLLAAAGYRGTASVLFVFTCLLETMRLFDAIFFFSQQDTAFLLRFLAEAPRIAELGWLVFVALLCTGLLLLWRWLVPRASGSRLWLAAAPFCALIAVLVAVDITQGYNPFRRQLHGRAREHMIGEVLARVPIELWQAARRHNDTTATGWCHSASDPLWNVASLSASKTNVLVVVVESMGGLNTPGAREREFSSLEDAAIRQRYDVSTGDTTFTGGTVTGEMRELCHLRTGVHVTAETLAGRQSCLPAQYAARGYRTAAYHGFRETMFRREDWYPLIGFQHETFLDQMHALPTCNGAYFGVCDAAVAGLIEKRLAAARVVGGPPQFLYWMTLNSHLPVDESKAPHLPCPLPAGDPGVCAQLAYVEGVLQSVRKIALDPAIGPLAIVVVGDHAPPYVSLENRDLFDSDTVPYLRLLPATAEAKAAR